MQNTPQNITAIILTYNSEELLADCLDSLHFCTDIIIIDSFSTDETLSIAKKYPQVRIFQQPYVNYYPQFSFGLEQAKDGWIISLDSDEKLDDNLQKNIQEAIANPEDYVGFNTNRLTWYYNRFLRHCYYPDYLLRVFQKKELYMTNSGAHQKLRTNGKTKKLTGNIIHYSYKNFEDHLLKLNRYAALGTKDLEARGKKGGIFQAIMHAKLCFFRLYFLKKGFLDGRAGFLYTAHYAFYTFIKYIRINEGDWGKVNRNREKKNKK